MQDLADEPDEGTHEQVQDEQRAEKGLKPVKAPAKKPRRAKAAKAHKPKAKKKAPRRAKVKAARKSRPEKPAAKKGKKAWPVNPKSGKPRRRPGTNPPRTDAAGSLGKRIAAARKKKGWSQKQLAVKTGYTQPGIANMERGVAPPSDEARTKLSRALGRKL
jgi:ribosome-binding protein aMBF1 (putative translation factor)